MAKKQSARKRIKGLLSPWFAVGGMASGSLFYALTHSLWQDAPTLLTSVFSAPSPFVALTVLYGEEVRLFLPFLALTFFSKSPLPLYALLSLRGFYLGFSATHLFTLGAVPFLTAVYLFFGGGILFAYTVSGGLVEKDLGKPKELLLPLLFYQGEIFLLHLFAHLLYRFILP